MKRLLIASFVLLMPTLAIAQPIDLTAPITDENGQPAIDCVRAATDGKSCAETHVVTVGFAMAHALFVLSEADKNVAAEERWKRGELGLRISHATSIGLTVDDAKMVKDAVGKTYPPLVVAQLFPLLDPNIKKDDPAAPKGAK